MTEHVVNAMYITVGVVFLASALWLLVFNFNDRLNRVFALYLFLEAGAMFTITIEPGNWWQTGLAGMFRWFALATSFPLLYLAAAYRERFGRHGRRRLILIGVLVGAVIVLGLHAMDNSFFAGPGARPLRPIHYALLLLGPAIMALLLAQDALAARGTERRRHLLSASRAFAFYPTAFALHLFIPDIMRTRPLEVAVAMTCLLPIGFTVMLVAQAARRGNDAHLRLAARNYLWILSLSPASVLALALAARWTSEGDAIMRFIMTGWLVVLALLVGYAILRHQLFGIERGLKWTLRRGSVPGMALGAFFVVLQIVEQQAQNLRIEGFPPLLAGALAAAAVGSLYQPLQRRVDRFASRTMPEVADSVEYDSYRRLQIYESALAAVWEDGDVGAEERTRLDRLRQRLKIGDADARALEQEYARGMGASG